MSWARLVALALGAVAAPQNVPHTAPTPDTVRPPAEPGNTSPDIAAPTPEETPPAGSAPTNGAHPTPEKTGDLGTSVPSLGVVGRVVRADGGRLTVRTDAGREIDLERPEEPHAAGAAPHVGLGDRVHANYRVIGGRNELVHVEVITSAPPS